MSVPQFPLLLAEEKLHQQSTEAEKEEAGTEENSEGEEGGHTD